MSSTEIETKASLCNFVTNEIIAFRINKFPEMRLLILTHYSLSAGPSMQVFPRLIAEGLSSRGHKVRILTAPALLGRLAISSGFQKWLGYIDQFLIFPIILVQRLKKLPKDTLIVISDQALGPWVWFVYNRPHVIHCHDFLALQGALGELPHHKLKWSGRLYQKFIKWGFSQGKNFISISELTRKNLHKYIQKTPIHSEVLLNPLRGKFYPIPSSEFSSQIAQLFPALSESSFLLHIGTNWYKNRSGVLAIWKKLNRIRPELKLVLVGRLEPKLKKIISDHSELKNKVINIDRVNDLELNLLYSAATALIFPSHAEGFGWPILEAMASGCPVITTNLAPMTEVGGDVPLYINPCSIDDHKTFEQWSQLEAKRIDNWLNAPNHEKEQRVARGIQRAEQFSLESWLNRLEYLYNKIINFESSQIRNKVADKLQKNNHSLGATTSLRKTLK